MQVSRLWQWGYAISRYMAAGSEGEGAAVDGLHCRLWRTFP
ncbi:MAG: hypothetical protein OXL36_02920 [Bryobacterales bacterium]|nr:hypothetical protein [Bryobacterales bacterium]